MDLWFRRLVRAAVLTVALFAVPGLPAAAAPSHDDARRAVEAGEIRPLAEILDIVRGKLPGEIVRVKLERKNDRWLYEFRIVDAKGRLFEVYVDARSGVIERIKEK